MFKNFYKTSVKSWEYVERDKYEERVLLFETRLSASAVLTQAAVHTHCVLDNFFIDPFIKLLDSNGIEYDIVVVHWGDYSVWDDRYKRMKYYNRYRIMLCSNHNAKVFHRLSGLPGMDRWDIVQH